MAEETSKVLATSTSFGYVIAFLLPGLSGLYALGYWSPTVRNTILLNPGEKPEATLGSSLILLLSALLVGLIVNAFRAWFFEGILCHDMIYDPDFFSKVGTGEKMLHFRVLVDELFRYHQFYGGMFVSFCPMYVGWFCKSGLQMNGWTLLGSTIVFVILEWRLQEFAVENYCKFVTRANVLVR